MSEGAEWLEGGYFSIFPLSEEHIMQALRKIMVAKELSPVMDIPDNMQGIQVEVIVLPINGIAAKPKINVGLVKKLKGSLKQYANANLRTLEKKAFEMAIEENYKKGKYNAIKNYSIFTFDKPLQRKIRDL